MLSLPYRMVAKAVRGWTRKGLENSRRPGCAVTIGFLLSFLPIEAAARRFPSTQGCIFQAPDRVSGLRAAH